jgi:hypothetical protein
MRAVKQPFAVMEQPRGEQHLLPHMFTEFTSQQQYIAGPASVGGGA